MLNFKFSNICGVVYNTANLLFTKDNDSLLISPIGNKMSVFDLKNGTSSTLPIECRSTIHRIDITTDGKLLVAADRDGYCILINLPKQIIIGHMNFRGVVSSMKISPNSKFIAVGINKSIKIFEMPSMSKEYEPLVLYKHYTTWQNDTITSINWSKDSRTVLTGSKDTTVRLLNLFKIHSYIPFMFTGHKRKIINALFSEDHQRIFSISQEGVLFVWKYVDEQSDEFIKKNTFERRVKANKNLKSLQEILKERGGANEDNDESEDEEQGDMQGETTTNDDMEYYSDFEKMIMKGRYIMEKKQQFIINGKITICDINSNSNILVFGLNNGEFSIYDINTFTNKYTLKISDAKINTLSINNSGLWLAFGSKKLGQLLVWEWKAETYVYKQQGHFFDVSCICYSPDSSLIASGAQDGRIKVWDTSNASCVITFTEHTSKVTDVKFAPNKGNVLISCSLDGTARAYDLIKYRNFRIMTTPKPCQFQCIAIDFSGEIVCAGSLDPYSIFVWSLKTGDLIDILAGHAGPISCLAFSMVKDMLVSGSWDKTVKIWELYSKKGQAESFEHNSEVVAIDLTPDDKEIAASTLNGELYTWDISTGSIRNIIDTSRDIWGGRLKNEKFTSQSSTQNKYLNTINYNLSGNLLISGGNSAYVLLYDMHYQILIKKFCLTHNRSMDGILYKLNSKDLKEGGRGDLQNFEDSEDSDDPKKKNFLGTIPGNVNSLKNGNPQIKIISVKFSQTNRAWAVGTTEGIFIFSLDSSLTFSSLNLDINITVKDAEEAFSNGAYLKSIVFSFSLNKSDLIDRFLDYIPKSQVSLIANKLPFNVVGPFLDYLSKKMENGTSMQLYIFWVLNIVKYKGEHLKNLKNKSIFLNLYRSIHKTLAGLTHLVNDNIYTIKYLTEYKGDEEDMGEELTNVSQI